ncbi:unnamed protein product [Trichobilharzia regenti]|nr:unnamed protein product [Trichobilharzia regenti]
MFVQAADECSRYCTLRGQLDFHFAEKPLPLEFVEPAAEIVKRFSTEALITLVYLHRLRNVY